MKRAGNLMPRICDYDNINEAFLRAVKGKRGKREVIRFCENIDSNLREIAEKLYSGTYDFGHYHTFHIYDPKPRQICAAPFADRVAFHAMMRICHPVFDNYQIYDSYASRVDKGVYAAIEQAQKYARRYKWFVKIDACKYFDSIQHDILKRQLYRLFKDKMLLHLFDRIIDTYHVGENRGLPIGNLTSQYFANHYLAYADHFLKQQLHIRGTVRYMDDLLIFGDDHKTVLDSYKKYKCFLNERLKLETHEPVLNRVGFGVPFLGYVIYPHKLNLTARSRHRFRVKLANLERQWYAGQITDADYHEHIQALYAFTNKACIEKFNAKVIREKGIFP